MLLNIGTAVPTIERCVNMFLLLCALMAIIAILYLIGLIIWGLVSFFSKYVPMWLEAREKKEMKELRIKNIEDEVDNPFQK